VFEGNVTHYNINFDMEGKTFDEIQRVVISDEKERIGVQTSAAKNFIDRNHKNPFFLYLSYYAPHVPLVIANRYLNRFSNNMPVRRRAALALISAMDDGVGEIVTLLRNYGIEKNTLIFFISDNGAPLGLDMPDLAVEDDKGNWDGSRNDPYVGEKGMLTEGGIRVPFIAYWKGKIIADQKIQNMVLSLDATATAAALAGIDVSQMDGINLLPYLTEEQNAWPDRIFFWRWRNQEAVRNNALKVLRLSDGHEYLFDIDTDKHENLNLKGNQPNAHKQLKKHLEKWTISLKHNRMKPRPLPPEEERWYQHYFYAQGNDKQLAN